MSTPSWLDILIPRFITEDAAANVTYCGHCDLPHPQPVMPMSNVEPGNVFDGIITVRYFNLFGSALFMRWNTAMRPWVNPHDKAKT
jgi:hypothetical protein